MTSSNRAMVLLPLLVVLVLGLGGCNYLESPSDPDPVLTLAGTCRVSPNAAGLIVCEDRSSAEPASGLESITFTLTDSAGLILETRVANAEQTAPRQVLFAGLPRGSYAVEQVVKGRKGVESRQTYRDLVVTSSI